MRKEEKTMFKLPSTEINAFRASKRLAALPIKDNDRSVEIHIPGLLDPASVKITLKAVGANKHVFISGDYVDSESYKHGNYRIENHKINTFENQYVVPANATNHVPTASLTVAKDNCGNITEGVLFLQWEVGETNVPVTVKDCSPND